MGAAQRTTAQQAPNHDGVRPQMTGTRQRRTAPTLPLARRAHSDNVEPLSVLDCLDELLLRMLEALVLGQQQMVEAGVRRGQPVLVRAVLGDDEGEVAQPLDGLGSKG